MRNDATEGHTSLYDSADGDAPIRRSASGTIDSEFYTRRARQLRAAHLLGMLQDFGRFIARLTTACSGAASASAIPYGKRGGQIAGRCSCHD